ncbi:AbgT family transporter [Salinicoccus hispanicus]|uniref:AbgT family transporter n=1 Tax=Salinicoccus hispanicus TaxID=157225 RepID=A0A6N8U2Q2_9STAP|nr:AbgT family transporter [Salinicoccus hispanicus]MXQ51266.1 AbgT family transporter [Salinicoccus hispanicus]
MQTKEKSGLFNRFLNVIERLGNKLPDPIVLFIILMIAILIASFFAGMAGLEAENPADGETIQAVNLLSGSGMVQILTEAISNFSAFPPLGMVLVVMIGIGLAEKSGYFETAMRRAIEVSPQKLMLPAIILVGIIGNVAGDAGPIILPPIAAMVVMRLGYHPFVGLVMAYAAALGAFSANVIPGMSEALAMAFTVPAAQILNPDYTGNLLMNYYFTAVATLFLLIIIFYVTKKITIPRLGTYEGEEMTSNEPLKRKEITALRWANVSVILAAIFFMIFVIPENGILRNPETGSIVQESPFMDSIVFILTILFFVPGLVYGLVAGTLRTSKDFGRMLSDAMGTMGSYIVLVFFAAQMLAYFNWSNLGPIIAIKGANLLETMNVSGIPLFIGFIILAGLINMMIGSASAKWAILAPVFVPMFMLLGYDPALTQLLYRIGDSFSNPVTPMLPYLPLLLAFAQKYDKNAGLGTLIAALLPYAIVLFFAWTLLLIVWYLLGIPLGVDGPIHLPES